MSQQYPNGEKIISPGTVIVTSGGEVEDIRKVVSPVIVNDKNSSLYHIDFSFDEQRLGGSAFAQSLGKVGSDVPTVKNPEYFADCFNAVQELIRRGWIMAGHDICSRWYAYHIARNDICQRTDGGLHINLHNLAGDDVVKNSLWQRTQVLLSRFADEHKHELDGHTSRIMALAYAKIGYPVPEFTHYYQLLRATASHDFDIDALRDEVV